MFIALVLCAPALAEGSLSSKNRGGLFANQLGILDGRAAQQYSDSARLQPQPGNSAGPMQRYDGDYRGPYLALAQEAARRHDVPQDLFLRLVDRESGWDSNAVSDKGAVGLAQLMPETADSLGVDAGAPSENLDAGARYLRRQYDRFGSWRLALAAYNAGPAAVDAYDGIPPFDETVAYVRDIWGS